MLYCKGNRQWVADRGQFLSNIRRRAEALDEACLRALGHPRDQAIRSELLGALEWDAAVNPEHARPVIRDLFERVRDRSTKLLRYVRSGAHTHTIASGIESLRQSLADLVRVLAARQVKPEARPRTD